MSSYSVPPAGTLLQLNPQWQGRHIKPLHELYGIAAGTTARVADHQMAPSIGPTIVFDRPVVTALVDTDSKSGEPRIYSANTPYIEPAGNWIPVAEPSL